MKFRPNKRGASHLNGKVERSQKTDKIEFYATVDTQSEVIHDQLAEWKHYYNCDRPHSAHEGKSSIERFFELTHQTAFSDEVDSHCAPEKNEFAIPITDWICSLLN
ncbi:integrase core domain-containing protein [Aeromonas salmonicida]|uniref:integrase core domain-containing protein n=1 Tax=Aeromonas salmonicida TaxID=645 RepID=UPI0038D4ABAD